MADQAPATPASAEAAAPVDVSKVTKVEDLVAMAQTPEHGRAVAALESGIKLPSDLSKVSDAKARELSEAGVVDDTDLPGKMYKRKVDGFVARIPNYTFNAYSDVLKDEWEEIKLTSDV